VNSTVGAEASDYCGVLIQLARNLYNHARTFLQSIEFECSAVIPPQPSILHGFMQHAPADHEQIKLIAHKTTERIFWSTNDRLSAHVEAGIDQHAMAMASICKSTTPAAGLGYSLGNVVAADAASDRRAPCHLLLSRYKANHYRGSGSCDKQQRLSPLKIKELLSRPVAELLVDKTSTRR
jgi:hypothetical protein